MVLLCNLMQRNLKAPDPRVRILSFIPCCVSLKLLLLPVASPPLWIAQVFYLPTSIELESRRKSQGSVCVEILNLVQEVEFGLGPPELVSSIAKITNSNTTRKS